ncbi:MAG: amidase family protein [bacterium]
MKNAILVMLCLAACSDDHPEQILPPVACAPQSDVDTDGDGVVDECDVCPNIADPEQVDSDHDGKGDACSDDDDGDGILDDADTCPLIFNPNQRDGDSDGQGDVCDPTPFGDVDTDGDAVPDALDNCVSTANADQEDTDGDGVGNACDSCPNAVNGNQRDLDKDGVGDACDDDVAFTVEGASISDIHVAIQSGATTCEAVVQDYLQRMWMYDLDTRRGAVMNALIEVSPTILQQARDLDQAYAMSGSLSGPLHCAPFIVKANYANTELAASSGTVGMTDTVSKTDAFVVGKMKEAGAILIATANMDELAFGVFGISSDGGRTGNAFDPSYNSGGSSAGSAASIASSFAAFSMGTDNCASLTLPAALHGLVTMRSTTGLVSTNGVFPSGVLDAVAGPMTTTVSDMATVLDVIVKPDHGYIWQSQKQATRDQTYVSHLKRDGLKGKRIGIARWMAPEGEIEQFRFMFEGGSPEVHAVFQQVFRDLKSQGAELVENVSFPSLSTNRYGGGVVNDMDAFLANSNGPIHDYDEFCRTGGFSKWVYPSVDACLAAAARGRASDPTSGADKYEFNRDYAEKVMDRLGVDVLAYPVDALGSAQPNTKQPNCYISSVTGLPSITVVGGVHPTTGMPIGIMFTARAFDEDTLIEVAYAWEQATKRRPLPQMGESDAPEVDIFGMNLMHQTIARRGFDEVLKTGGKFDLSASKYLQLTTDYLRSIEASWLLP